MARMKREPIVLTLILACCSVLAAQSAPEVSAIEDELAGVAAYEYGQSRKPLVAVEEFTREALVAPAALAELERRFLTLLASGATPAGKDFVCRQLSLIGSAKSVPVLAGMLRDPATFEMARYALERIPGEPVDEALREAFPAAGAAGKLAIVNTLGNRGNPASVEFLARLSGSEGSELAGAAMLALAAVGSPPACAVVRRALAVREPRPAAAEAGLKCAGEMARRGDRLRALAMYRKLNAPEQAVMTRVAALNGLAATGGTDAIPVLQKSLAAEDGRLRAAAVRGLARIPGPDVTAILTASAGALPGDTRVQVISAIAERSGPAARDVLVAAVASSDVTIRTAALGGLGNLGSAKDVLLLAERAALAAGREQEIARDSLYRLHSPGVDEAILSSLPKANTDVKIQLIRAAGARAITAASPVLLAAARDPDRGVRREALGALRETAAAGDIPALIGLLPAYERQADRTEAQRTVASVIRRTGSSIESTLSAYSAVQRPEVKAALLWIMGQSGDADALPALRSALAADSAELKRAAILALSEWPDDRPARDLIGIARVADISAHRILALRGYVQLITLPSERSREATADLLKSAFQLADRPDEKMTILAALSQYPCATSLELARAAMSDPAIAAEAKAALQRMERQLK